MLPSRSRSAEPRRLTSHPALDYNAVFSPDGRWVVFTSERTDSADLHALDLEASSEPIRLTSHPAMDDAASFSPDGKWLTFVSTRDGDSDIFKMPFSPTDATAEDRAINLTRRPGGDFNPAFSPDGRKIAFSRQPCLWDEDGWHCLDLELWVMNADGSNSRRLADPGAGVQGDAVEILEGISGAPAWSKDGTGVYYHYGVGYEQRGADGVTREVEEGTDIRRVALDGSDDVLVVEGAYSPAIGPEGRIAFVRPSKDDGPPTFYSGRVHSVAADGSDSRAESPELESWLDSRFAPDYDRHTGRMVCHGASGDPLEGPELPHGRAFKSYTDTRRVELTDRTVELHGVGSYFPALTPTGDVLSTLRVRSARDASAGRLEELTVPLHVSAIDGSELREVFDPSSGIAWGAHVAPDAGWVVASVGLTFGAADTDVDVWKFRLDGSEATNLTSGSPGNNALPNISADGERIVFRRPRESPGDGEMAVFLMDGQGENQRRLTTGPNRETMPAISPDGTWVAYVVLSGYEVAKIWLSRVDGSERRLLEPERADIPDLSLHPRFSPDGQWVVFTSDRGGLNDERLLTPQPQPYGELYAVPISGGPALRLTHDKWENGPNDWGYLRPATERK
jgi:Tol biopolymer transport system component